MRTKRSGAIFLLAAACLGAPSWAQDAPPIRAFDAATIEKLGLAIYRQDQEAAQATDLLLKNHPDAELQKQNLRGWVVDPTPDGDVIRFIRDDGGLQAAYDVAFKDGAAWLLAPLTPVLTDQENAQFAARNLAATSIARPCAQQYNLMSLQDPEGDGWLVWALAVAPAPGSWFIGGNYRFTISRDGSRVLQADALSRGCLLMAPQPPPPGSAVAAQVSSQLISDIPVETVVLVNLQSGIPMFVATPDRTVWQIEQGRMSKAGTVPGTPPAQ